MLFSSRVCFLQEKKKEKEEESQNGNDSPKEKKEKKKKVKTHPSMWDMRRPRKNDLLLALAAPSS